MAELPVYVNLTRATPMSFSAARKPPACRVCAMSDSIHSIAKKGEKYTAAQVIAAVRETKGMLTIAAKRLGCDPVTIYRYMR